MKKIYKNRKGASVIEVLLSIGLTAVLIASIGGSLAAVHRLNTASGVKEKATAYAEQAMELITEFKNNPNNNFSDPIASCTVASCPNSPTLESPYTCTCIVNSPDPDRQNVTVAIQYDNKEKIRFSTIFTNWRNP